MPCMHEDCGNRAGAGAHESVVLTGTGFRHYEQVVNMANQTHQHAVRQCGQIWGPGERFQCTHVHLGQMDVCTFTHLIRQLARRPRGLLRVARFREAWRAAYMARDDPVSNVSLCCQKLFFFLTLLSLQPPLPSKANPPSRPSRLTPWPTEEHVRVRIVASQTLNCCMARLVA